MRGRAIGQLEQSRFRDTNDRLKQMEEAAEKGLRWYSTMDMLIHGTVNFQHSVTPCNPFSYSVAGIQKVNKEEAMEASNLETLFYLNLTSCRTFAQNQANVLGELERWNQKAGLLICRLRGYKV